MLTIEIKVNGNIVAAIQAANVTSDVYEADGFVFSYRDAKNAARTWASKVKHLRADGILRLAALLLADAANVE